MFCHMTVCWPLLSRIKCCTHFLNSFFQGGFLEKGLRGPSPPARGLGNTVSPPVGSGVKPRPKLILVHFQACKRHLVVSYRVEYCHLFNIYVYELIGLLRSTNAGCHIADVFIGCIMYVDDLILLSPCVAGLQSMLDVCTVYGNEFDIVFNAKSVLFGKRLMRT